MQKFTSFILISSFLLTLNAIAGQASIKVIYGDDDRVDVIDSNNSLYLKLAKSTAAMISTSKIKDFNNAQVEITGKTLEQNGVCASEPFAKQLAAANCSGFLVGEKTLVTAGHCIRSQFDCDKYSWVFDYKVDFPTQSEMIIDKSSVYSCKKLVKQELDSASGIDYAVIELDKVVTDRAPLKFRTEGSVQVGDPLVVIGHPSGLPTKVADGANVRAIKEKYLVANLDTYGGNSGSAVFNSVTGVVEGILVRGETDYVYDPSQGCRVSNVVADSGGRGEDVTLITQVKDLPEQPVQEEPDQDNDSTDDSENDQDQDDDSNDDDQDEDNDSDDDSDEPETLIEMIRRLLRSIFG